MLIVKEFILMRKMKAFTYYLEIKFNTTLNTPIVIQFPQIFLTIIITKFILI